MTFTLPPGMTQAQAARLALVTTRTIQNWLIGKGQPSQQQAAVLEVAADAAAIDAAEPMTLAERIAALRAIQQQQMHRCCVLEDDLAQAQRDLGATSSKLNALYAERSKTGE